MATLKEIEALTLTYAESRDELATELEALEDEVTSAKKRRRKRLQKLVDQTKDWRSKLSAAIESSPELFVKPRSVVFNSVRVGLQKATGKIEFADASQVVKLIRKQFPEQFDVLVKTTEKPVKAALSQLSAADLKKLGINVVSDGDEVLIKDTFSEIYKAIDALLKDEQEEIEA